MTPGDRERAYDTLARTIGVALVVICVFFQRRGLMDWSEFVFLGLCVALQETFLRLPSLRKLRTPMLVFYSGLPLLLVLYHAPTIRRFDGDFVQIVLYTPLPLVLVSVQIMVLYVRESARLVSVVLVLALFSTVIGVRRPLDDAVWPWLAGIGALSALFLIVQHPGMLFHGVYVAKRKSGLPPAGRPGGIIRGSFFGVLPVFVTAVLVGAVVMYFSIPRIEFEAEGQPQQVTEQTGPGNRGTSTSPDGSTNTNPRVEQREGPATVSGLSEGVELGDFGQIKLDEADALELKLVDPPNNVPKKVYLRAFTFGTFDGWGWQPLPENPATTHEIAPANNRELLGTPLTRGLGWARRSYEVRFLESGLGAGGQLPLPVEPKSITNYDQPIYYDSQSNTTRAPLMQPGDELRVAASELIATEAQLRRELAGITRARTPRQEYLQLPEGLKEDIETRFNYGEGRLYDRFRTIAEASDRSGSRQQRGVFACATDIVTMFRDATIAGGDKAWVYSLDFRPQSGTNAIARFLDTGSREAERFGHCEYFASAMCLLLRCYGVPARVVAGFVATDANEEGLFEVTAASAHAWVEVYFDRFGWLTFDPTPPDPTATETSTETNKTTETTPEPVIEPPMPEIEPDEPDPVVEEKDNWFDRFDKEDQREMFNNAADWFKEAGGKLDEMLLSATGWMPDFIPRSGFLRILLLLTPLSVGFFVYLWLRRKRKKIEAKVLERMGEGGRKRQRGLYFQLLMLLAGYGFQKRASETPREFAERVWRKGGNKHSPVKELTELYYALRFGLNAGLEQDFKRGLVQYSELLKSESLGAASPARPA